MKAWDEGQGGAWEGFWHPGAFKQRECIVLWPKFLDLELQGQKGHNEWDATTCLHSPLLHTRWSDHDIIQLSNKILTISPSEKSIVAKRAATSSVTYMVSDLANYNDSVVWLIDDSGVLVSIWIHPLSWSYIRLSHLLWIMPLAAKIKSSRPSG